MGATDHQKLEKKIKLQIAESGGVSVSFDCGNDQTGVGFSGWKDDGSGRWTDEKYHLRGELIRKLHLPNASENKVEGNGWIEINDGRVELTYSLTDKGLSNFSAAEMLLPFPDVEHVLLRSQETITKFDFEVSLNIASYDLPDTWHSEKNLATLPKVTGDQRKRLVEMLTPVISPLFKDVTTSTLSREVGDIFISDFDFRGFYWHSTGEMYYSISFGRERVRQIIKSEKMELFDGSPAVSQ